MPRSRPESSIIRRLSVFDLDEFESHLLRLDPESRRLRFGGIVCDDFLSTYARSATRWDVVIYGNFVGGTLRGAAELRPIQVWGTREAELAFSVEQKWRGRGVGGQLFQRMMRAARNRGYRRLYMSCLAENRAMQSLARKFAASVSYERGSSVGVVDPGSRSPASLLSEATDEAAAYTFATIQLPGWRLLPGLFGGTGPTR